MSNLRAIGKWLFIQLDKRAEQSQGGILFAEQWQTPEGSGRVVYAGRGWHDRKGNFIPMDVQVGQRVAFRWFDAQRFERQLEWEGQRYCLLQRDELVGIVENDECQRKQGSLDTCAANACVCHAGEVSETTQTRPAEPQEAEAMVD